MRFGGRPKSYRALARHDRRFRPRDGRPAKKGHWWPGEESCGHLLFEAWRRRGHPSAGLASLPTSSAAAADGTAYCPLGLKITAEQQACKQPGTKLPAERRSTCQAQNPAGEGQPVGVRCSSKTTPCCSSRSIFMMAAAYDHRHGIRAAAAHASLSSVWLSLSFGGRQLLSCAAAHLGAQLPVLQLTSRPSRWAKR